MGDNTKTFYRVHLQQIDSTNRYLRDEACSIRACAGKDSLLVVTADSQTKGRGQRGNVWLSQSGCNMLLSMLVNPHFLPVERQFLLSQVVALSLHRSMASYGIDVLLKWPNDIYVGSRKLAGVLIELDYSGNRVEQAIIGVGLNVNQTMFDEMDRIPVSMKMLKGCDYTVDDVVENFIAAFSYYYERLEKGDENIAREYADLLLGKGKVGHFVDSDGCFDAVIMGVEPSGFLLLERLDGTNSRYAFKEVEQIIR
ncbi:MAG: biotin--[Bacteroidaceae bacterium]|nr:biotin--[acetyl-CoA-carboxylase] ligase [Bacteroidaceae bacterium]